MKDDKITVYKTDNYNERATIAIMFQIPILITQLLLIYSFPRLESVTKLGIKALQIIVLFLAILKSYQSVYMLIKCESIAVMVFGITYLFHQPSQEHFLSYFIYVVIIIMPVFSLALCITDFRYFMRELRKASIYIIIVGYVMFVLLLMGVISFPEAYNMPYSYYLLVPSIYYIAAYMQNSKLSFLFLGGISLIPALIYGSRGMLLCVAFYVVAKVLLGFFDYKKVKRKTITFMAILLLVAISFDKIMFVIGAAAEKFGFGNSRSIKLLTNNLFYNSGRTEIWKNARAVLSENWLFGVGITGEIDTVGNFAHNLFYEILLNYGVIIGGIIIIFLLRLIIKSIKKMAKMNNQEGLILIALGLIPLLISDTYFKWTWFWVMIAYFISYGKRDQEYSI